METLKQDGCIRLREAGSEYVVELAYLEDNQGHVAVCGMYVTKELAAAESYFTLAVRIRDCWYVDKVYENNGMKTTGNP